ncbi:Translocase of chloroplast, chloroplastic [Quillaja saponaria]|uniref:Translocase of chloroplast, chloroplastic n=1 Tax=Quillaja saponaria TaxID=32244 RepID=A0AAD7LBK8_QUISA|nr:Translocase of chloroplast, chloroplastic [Quillaja saponaria]
MILTLNPTMTLTRRVVVVVMIVGFESEGFISGEEFETASERPFVADPDEETLENGGDNVKYETFRPYVVDFEGETIDYVTEEEEESSEVGEFVPPVETTGVHSLNVTRVMPIAQLSRDDDDDDEEEVEEMVSEEEDSQFLSVVRVAGIGAPGKLGDALRIKALGAEEREGDDCNSSITSHPLPANEVKFTDGLVLGIQENKTLVVKEHGPNTFFEDRGSLGAASVVCGASCNGSQQVGQIVTKGNIKMDIAKDDEAKQLLDAGASSMESHGRRVTITSADDSKVISMKDSAAFGSLLHCKKPTQPLYHSVASDIKAGGDNVGCCNWDSLCGVGKSATINSIFGEAKVKTDAFKPATTSIEEVFGTIDGIKIRILDTPGLGSSAMEQAFNRKILSSVKKYIKKFPPDIVLYVDRVDTLTSDFIDLPLLKSITSSLKSSIWKSAIITLTHAAAVPLDGPSGSPISYEVLVARKSHVVQQSIKQAIGDVRLMSDSVAYPVTLVENHPLCGNNIFGECVLPDGFSWRTQLLLMCFSLKLFAEVIYISSEPHNILYHWKQWSPFGFWITDSMCGTDSLDHDCGLHNVSIERCFTIGMYLVGFGAKFVSNRRIFL